MNETVSLEVAIEVVLRNGPTFETIAGLCKMAVEAEREACAKVCDVLGVHPALNVFNGGPEWYKHGKDCAAAIRARGDQ